MSAIKISGGGGKCSKRDVMMYAFIYIMLINCVILLVHNTLCNDWRELGE